jgi:hypothetical protein
MSTILYGRLTRRAEATPPVDGADAGMEPEPESALAQQVAALVPAEVLVIHGIILAAATSVGDDGSTTVTKPDLLKWTLPILLVLSVALYVISRAGAPAWKLTDYLRMVIPGMAFFAWTLLTGTSAATPWFTIDRGWLFLIGGVIAAVALAITTRVTPAQP